MIQKRHVRTICFVLIVCLISAVFFSLLYQFDNKYTTRAEVSQDGSTMISPAQTGDGTPSQETMWLVDGWEFYPDQLIEPGDETGESVPIYIGQYFSFSAFHQDSSPHGVGTYRLTVRGQRELYHVDPRGLFRMPGLCERSARHVFRFHFAL